MHPAITSIPKIYACSAGLGSRDVRGGHFIAMTRNIAAAEPREHPLARLIGHQRGAPAELALGHRRKAIDRGGRLPRR